VGPHDFPPRLNAAYSGSITNNQRRFFRREYLVETFSHNEGFNFFKSNFAGYFNAQNFG
jgi:hypothetical protein